MRYICLFVFMLCLTLPGIIDTMLFGATAKADPRTDCPEVGKACKVLVLTEGEQGVLLNEKGILATAAAARNLDLGSLATYFQQKIANAPAGDVKDPPKPAELQGNPALGAGPSNPAASPTK